MKAKVAGWREIGIVVVPGERGVERGGESKGKRGGERGQKGAGESGETEVCPTAALHVPNYMCK